MGVQLGDEVGYSIRFEDRTSSKTCIKYLTDGCLLRECLFDYKFQQYSVIILDEAHERSLNTDILLGLLKRVAAERKPELKVIVTSATLDGQKFSEYFFNCPVVTVPGKLYPVQLLYSVDRPVNYLDSSVQTALDIHVREPPGDILLFMTGQEEILKAITMLEERVKALEEGSCLDVEILPLYASLPPESQVDTGSCVSCTTIQLSANYCGNQPGGDFSYCRWCCVCCLRPIPVMFSWF
jgi:ATP-dependent RNA helicase DHX8/PRP22